MTSAAQKNKGSITLKGSADIVCEYLDFGINSILFQRGIYPPESFKAKEMYGLTILMSEDNKIKEFLQMTLKQLNQWLMDEVINKVSLVITNVRTKEVMERWDFKVQYEAGNKENKDTNNKEKTSDKPLKQIRNEIRDVLKQIASSVSYLPLLDCLCSFDLLFYTKEESEIALPSDWADTQPAAIKNAQSVNLRSFSTNLHKVDTAVVYKNDD